MYYFLQSGVLIDLSPQLSDVISERMCVLWTRTSCCVAYEESFISDLHVCSHSLGQPQGWVWSWNECGLWPFGRRLGRGLISQLPSSCWLSFSSFRPWPMYQRTVSLCWMDAERTGKNGRLLQNSRRRRWLMGRAASLSGIEWPSHTGLKFTDGVF